MSTRWFVDKGGKPKGPFTLAELQQLAAKGEIGRITLLRSVDDSKPMLACKVKGLFPELPRPEPNRRYPMTDFKCSGCGAGIVRSALKATGGLCLTCYQKSQGSNSTVRPIATGTVSTVRPKGTFGLSKDQETLLGCAGSAFAVLLLGGVILWAECTMPESQDVEPMARPTPEERHAIEDKVYLRQLEDGGYSKEEAETILRGSRDVFGYDDD